MANKNAKPVKITEVALRDAHQSLIATRMTMDEMRPILPAMDEVGYYSVECWGGATFDSCIRFLNEDPWERLRILRKEMPNTKLQMLFRGQNMLGYRHYADDVVEYFVQKSVANGIDIMRIFDALNDPRNLETAIKAAVKEKAHVQACISYTLGTSHMPTESLVAALQGTEYDTGLDLKKLNVVREHFAKLREKYLQSGLLSPKMLGVDANTLLYQVPGGMLSNLLSQLKEAGKEDKLEDVLKEIPAVRKDSGYPPLVTPTSQIVGTQAVFNVLLGQRYKMVTKEFKGLVHGDYGHTPAPIDPEFAKQILKGQEPITCRPADLLEPEMDKIREQAKPYMEQEEDCLTYAMFPQVAPKFFETRKEMREAAKVREEEKQKIGVDFAAMSHPVKLF